MARWMAVSGDGNGRSGHPDGDAPDDRVQGLTGRELLVLQLVARGYSREQVADLIDGDEGDVMDALACAVWALGAADATEAIAVGRARNLIG
jgi:DNA-binding NarL/FixJ family response regulator